MNCFDMASCSFLPRIIFPFLLKGTGIYIPPPFLLKHARDSDIEENQKLLSFDKKFLEHF